MHCKRLPHHNVYKSIPTLKKPPHPTVKRLFFFCSCVFTHDFPTGSREAGGSGVNGLARLARSVISGVWRGYVVGVEASEKTNATTTSTKPILAEGVIARPFHPTPARFTLNQSNSRVLYHPAFVALGILHPALGQSVQLSADNIGPGASVRGQFEGGAALLPQV